MKNIFLKLSGYMAAAAVLVTAVSANTASAAANIWGIASTTELLTDTFSDLGTIMTFVLGSVIAVALALVALGFGWRYLKKYVTGKKF